ncbi:MAG TPA: MMPL family transporter, partial [Thermomonospora sp.]|nr:MMPL family transporter [Thermomonospora sp.]
PALRSRDGRAALITARTRGGDGRADRDVARLAARLRTGQDGFEVSIAGAVATRHALHDIIAEDLRRAEAVALPLTLVVLVWAFGSVVAALLPLLVGVVAIVGCQALLRFVADVTEVSVFAQSITTALGLGLAIDYALLVVRRYREELHGGAEPPDAIATTLRTAGRTIVFSALTVGGCLAALAVFPMYVLRSLAYAGVCVTLLTAAAALVVLPAALVLLGRRVDALDVRRLLRRRPRGAPGEGWERLARVIMGRAPAFATLTMLLLITLCLPFAGVRFGTVDERQLPPSAEPRRAQEAIRDGFGAQGTGTVDVVVRDAAPAAVTGYARRLSTLADVATVQSPAGTFAQGRVVGPPDPARARPGLAHLVVTPSVDDISARGQRVVRQVRGEHAPGDVLVGGRAAELCDTKRAIAARLPWALGIVAVAALTLLFLMTGSLLLPLKAILIATLSLTATFGTLVWVFQEGHLSGALGFTATGTIETSLPVTMFCLAFGLSMDYGVFLLARIKEEYDRTGDNQAAVAAGLRHTAGVITAAALVMAIVFAGVGASQIMTNKMLGLGVALAIVMDVTLVRCLLVPATMAIAGRATWWSPTWLARLAPRGGG